MADFDMSKDYRLAGAALFVLASIGLGCNVTVVTFLKSMPSLKNAFGSLTLSQAIVDTIHQSLFAFYIAPAIFLQSSAMYAISDQIGYIGMVAYQICCYSHLCISINRFVAVCAPWTYMALFSVQRTRILIIGCWLIGFCHMTYLMKIKECSLFLPERSWIWSLTSTSTCEILFWNADFMVNSTLVFTVAVLDVTSIARIHCMKAPHTDTGSMQRRKALKNLTYQAALQGICFISELVTYFILSYYARNKWELFALTSVAWCLVNGMDGLTVLVCNQDFRRQFRKIVLRETTMQGATTVWSSQGAHSALSSTAVSAGVIRQN